MVLTTKYHRKIFNDGVFGYMLKKLQELTDHYPEIDTLEINHDKDHIHILVSIPPKFSVGKVVGIISYKRHVPLHIVDEVKVLTGSEVLSCYRFNPGKGAHYFCKRCGIFMYSTPPVPVYLFAINLAMLDDCDWESLPLHHFNGKSL